MRTAPACERGEHVKHHDQLDYPKLIAGNGGNAGCGQHGDVNLGTAGSTIRRSALKALVADKSVRWVVRRTWGAVWRVHPKLSQGELVGEVVVRRPTVIAKMNEQLQGEILAG